MNKPFSQACANNQQPLLQVLNSLFEAQPGPIKLLEIGSGTGQHGVYFAGQLPRLQWQYSDLPGNHPGIQAWLADYPGTNLLPPLALDVSASDWPSGPYDVVFSANTLHIMAWERVLDLLEGVARLLSKDGLLIIYGPFNYAGRYTSDSNARFDQWLAQQSPDSAIRDFEGLCDEAQQRGLLLRSDTAMPANNRCLVFVRQSD